MKNILKKSLLGVGIGLLLSAVFAAGLVAGVVGVVRDGVHLVPGALPETAGEAGPFFVLEQVREVLRSSYAYQPVDDQVLLRGALRGMLAELGDPHTAFLDPVEQDHSARVLSGNYEGIGATVDTTGEYILIVAPMPSSPAEKAGLLPGDQVVSIDGKDMTGVNPEEALQSVLGPAGSTVGLGIRREGVEEILVFEIVRDRISLPSVEANMLGTGDIGYIRINIFGETTAEELETAIRDLRLEGATSLVLDLRNNGGGYLNAAVDVASQFIASGPILTEQFSNGETIVYEAKAGGLATDMPVAVLINPGSASASEIVAGAIRDSGRGPLVGETSFGKGSVQKVMELPDGLGAIKVTVALWLTRGGHQIDGAGLTPDIAVAPAQDGSDLQLEKAIEILLDMMQENSRFQAHQTAGS